MVGAAGANLPVDFFSFHDVNPCMDALGCNISEVQTALLLWMANNPGYWAVWKTELCQLQCGADRQQARSVYLLLSRTENLQAWGCYLGGHV